MRLRIEITYMRKINWSLLRAGIPLVWKLAIRNRGSVPASGLNMRLSLQGYPDTGPFPIPSGLQLHAALARLTELDLLQAQKADKGYRFSAHPLVGQYFYRALLEDAIRFHEGVQQYLARRLEPEVFRIHARGAVRTRGAAVSRHSRTLPRDTIALDLLEGAICFALMAGFVEEAYQLYCHTLGGYQHLGEVLADHARGTRITTMFLPPAETAPTDSYLWLDQIRRDYERYRKALEAE